MRQIIFRGQHIITKEWIEGSLIRYRDGDCFICCDSEDDDVLSKYAVIPETVGQYTGLKDKIGKRIWEGDIIRFVDDCFLSEDGEIGQVVFRNGCYGIEYVWSLDRKLGHDTKSFHRIGQIDHWQDMGASCSVAYVYRKIGNVHDNPELLKGGEE